MTRFKRLLVPIDFSPGSRVALLRAVEIARRCGGELTLQTIVEPREVNTLAYMYRGNDVEQQLIARFAESLDRAVEEAGGADCTVHRLVTLGTPFLEVLKAGLRLGADLVVIASRGTTGIESLFPLASTTYRVVRQAPCSVFCVPPDPAPVDLAGQPRTVLVPVDFSDHSMRALGAGVELAAGLGARLVLLTVDEDLQRPEHEAVALDRLREAAMGFDVAGLDVSYRVAHRNAVQSILQVAEEEGADPIVIGSHGGANVLRNLLLGDTVYQVVRRAKCGVMIIKAAV